MNQSEAVWPNFIPILCRLVSRFLPRALGYSNHVEIQLHPDWSDGPPFTKINRIFVSRKHQATGINSVPPSVISIYLPCFKRSSYSVLECISRGTMSKLVSIAFSPHLLICRKQIDAYMYLSAYILFTFMFTVTCYSILFSNKNLISSSTVRLFP